MDQPGTRHPSMKNPIIEHAGEQLSAPQRIVDGAVTFAFWVFWIYLWLPLLALLAWALGVQQAYKYMIVLGGFRSVVNLLAIYGMVIALLGGTLIAWAVYNILRFGGVERRVPRPPITAAEIARDFDFDPIEVERWQAAQSVQVTHDQNGRIVRVEIPVAAAKVFA